MTESEAWFLLAEEIENSEHTECVNYYLCHILRSLIVGEPHSSIMNGLYASQDIPPMTAFQMRKRFRFHLGEDQDGYGNPNSWYSGHDPEFTNIRNFNPWRVMFCTLMGFEALEEGR